MVELFGDNERLIFTNSRNVYRITQKGKGKSLRSYLIIS